MALSPHINLIDSLHYAKNIKLSGNIEDTYEPVIIDEKKDPELVAINSDLSSVLVGALDKIPIDQRIIVELKNIEGRSHKEIAEILGISVTAAKVRLHRAHQKLRQILEEVER